MPPPQGMLLCMSSFPHFHVCSGVHSVQLCRTRLSAPQTFDAPQLCLGKPAGCCLGLKVLGMPAADLLCFFGYWPSHGDVLFVPRTLLVLPRLCMQGSCATTGVSFGRRLHDCSGCRCRAGPLSIAGHLAPRYVVWHTATYAWGCGGCERFWLIGLLTGCLYVSILPGQRRPCTAQLWCCKAHTGTLAAVIMMMVITHWLTSCDVALDNLGLQPSANCH